MGARRIDNVVPISSKRSPAATPVAQENKLIALAVDTAEKQMRDGTVSSQVLTHYLKLGSTRERLEQQRLRGELELLQKKVESMASAERMEELYEGAINAMRGYQGLDAQPKKGDEDDYDD